jgi:hypothetical protein
MEYQVQYCTDNTYEQVVNSAIYELLVLPCQDETQQVAHIKAVNSLNEEIFSYKNIFGYEVLRFRTSKPFQQLNLCINAKVSKHDKKALAISPFSPAQEQAIIHSRDFFIEHNLFLLPSYYTAISPDNASFVLKHDKQSYLLDFLYQLNAYLYNIVDYNNESTDVQTTANEVIKLKKGVCQDFAHLFIAIARQNNIPARYVSGYLHQGKNFKGSTFMHAWAEAFVPELGWIGFDPSNNLTADELFIKVATGIDYADCSPIRGILNTASHVHVSTHSVTMQ